MLISPLNFKEFDSSNNSKDVRVKPFAKKKMEEVVETPPPPPSFSEEQLKAAERDAYQRGFLEGIKEGQAQAQNEQADIERTLLEGLEKFAASITPIFAQYKQHCAELRRNMPPLALAIARKVAGRAIDGQPATILESASQQCSNALISEPQVTVTIHSRLADALSNKLKHLAQRERSAGQISVIADDNIIISDYKIEWKNGSIERSTEKLWQQMEKAIEDMLATLDNEKEEQLDLLQQNIEGATNG